MHIFAIYKRARAQIATKTFTAQEWHCLCFQYRWPRVIGYVIFVAVDSGADYHFCRCDRCDHRQPCDHAHSIVNNCCSGDADGSPDDGPSSNAIDAAPNRHYPVGRSATCSHPTPAMSPNPIRCLLNRLVALKMDWPMAACWPDCCSPMKLAHAMLIHRYHRRACSTHRDFDGLDFCLCCAHVRAPLVDPIYCCLRHHHRRLLLRRHHVSCYLDRHFAQTIDSAPGSNRSATCQSSEVLLPVAFVEIAVVAAAATTSERHCCECRHRCHCSMIGYSCADHD